MTTILNYRVLGAMVALQEFDVKQLSQLSGVKLATVRTIVSREKKNLLEEIDQLPRSARGGRLIRYRVRPDKIVSLTETIDSIYTGLQTPEPPTKRGKNRSDVPLAVLAAEDALLRRFPKATSEERLRLLKLTEIAQLHDQDSGVREDPIAAVHFRCIDALKILSSAELALESGSIPTSIPFGEICSKMLSAASESARVGNLNEAKELVDRFAKSPITVAARGVLLEIPTHGVQPGSLVEVASDNADSQQIQWILAEAARISSIADAQEQIDQAFLASSVYSRLASGWAPLSLASNDDALNRFVDKIRTATWVSLTNEDIKTLATTPAFYCSNVVWPGENGEDRPRLWVYAFLKAVVNCKPIKESRHGGAIVNPGVLEVFAAVA